MKRKIIAIFITLNFIFSNINIYAYNLNIKDKAISAFASKKEYDIYCDTTGHWCNYSAGRLYSENIFTGIKIGDKYYFMPDQHITRGEFLLYLNAVLKMPTEKDVTLPFNDTSSIPSWQISTVKTMFKNGYVNGKREKGKLFFNYDEKISRLECAIIINNVLGLDSNEKNADFSDSYLIPKYAAGAVKNASDYGIMNGYEDKSFRPYVKITRAMLADILCRLKDYKHNTK